MREAENSFGFFSGKIRHPTVADPAASRINHARIDVFDVWLLDIEISADVFILYVRSTVDNDRQRGYVLLSKCGRDVGL
jgi:hypothetical protein